jgi:thiol-disulfide isomerase/thioredoxin
MATAKRLLSMTALLALVAAAHAGPGDLAPGQPAPPLSVKRWIKGGAVDAIAPSGIYVVEFWATWCGPCIDSIPHLTATAKKNPDVTFVGVSIWEDDGSGIDKFVKKMGVKMDYHVGYSGNQDGMSETWMKASGQNGIPTAFIVKDGAVQWIGHPMELEAPLAKVKAGTFDLEAFKREFDKANEASRKEAKLFEDLQAVEKQFATDRSGAKAALTKIARENPKAAESAAAMRFAWLAVEDQKAWDSKARILAKSGKSVDMNTLLSFAYHQSMVAKTVPLARRAMAIALQAEPKGFDALNYAYHTYRQTKDYDKALDATRKMLLYFPTGQTGGQPDFKKELLKRKTELLALIKSRV